MSKLNCVKHSKRSNAFELTLLGYISQAVSNCEELDEARRMLQSDMDNAKRTSTATLAGSYRIEDKGTYFNVLHINSTGDADRCVATVYAMPVKEVAA